MKKQRKTNFDDCLKPKNKYIECFNKNITDSSISNIFACLKEVDEMVLNSDPKKLIEDRYDIIEFSDFFIDKYSGTPVMDIIHDDENNFPKILQFSYTMKKTTEMMELRQYVDDVPEKAKSKIQDILYNLIHEKRELKIFALYDDYQEHYSNIMTITEFNQESIGWVYLHMIYCMFTAGVLIITYPEEEFTEITGYGFSKKHIYPLSKLTLEMIVKKSKDKLAFKNIKITEKTL
jgi:hypothetical protein